MPTRANRWVSGLDDLSSSKRLSKNAKLVAFIGSVTAIAGIRS
jgi:hypothetical protein